MTQRSDGPIPFTGSLLDYAELDRSEATLDAFKSHEKASVVLLHRGKIATDKAGLLRARPNDIMRFDLDQPGLIFLGLEGDGDPVFAASLTQDDQLPADSLIDLRLHGHHLPPDELAVAGRARSMLDWHRTHPFCAQCGHPSKSEDGGAKRICGHCEAEHFPRVNPVVIFLIEHEGSVLLGRGPNWPPGAYSALAGFVSPGESLEEAATREGSEEAGTRLISHRYVFSQPWPFPSQLMIGLISQAEDKTINVDPGELEAARWFNRDEVDAVMNHRGDAFLCPPRTTIAHQLLKAWLEETA